MSAIWDCPDEKPPFAEFAAGCKALAGLGDLVAWRLGKAWAKGEDWYPTADLLALAYDIDRSVKTLQNWATVWKAFPTPNSRRRELHHAHHAEAAVLDTAEERGDALQWAVTNDASSREMREEVQRRKAAARAEQHPFEPCDEDDTAQIDCGDCLDLIACVPDGAAALVLFSLPYGDAREYGGNWRVDPPALCEHIARVLTPGGIAVPVIADVVDKRTKQRRDDVVQWYKALEAASLTYREHLIAEIGGAPGAYPGRFRTDHHSMWVFCKGNAPATVHKERLALPRKTRKALVSTRPSRRDGQRDVVAVPIGDTAERGSVWRYAKFDRSQDDQLRIRHPASFPTQLAIDHVLCWTNPGDLVLDPFCGSGTTGVACVRNDRYFLGFDINPEYLNDIARPRFDLAFRERTQVAEVLPLDEAAD